MSVDLTPIVQPVIALAGAVITGLAAIYVPKAIAAFQTRTGIILTENQRKTVLDAVQTGAGLIETALDKGATKIEQIDVGSPVVTLQALAVVKSVPVAAGALGLTTADVARMIVGAVDTTPRVPPAPVTGIVSPASAT